MNNGEDARREGEEEETESEKKKTSMETGGGEGGREGGSDVHLTGGGVPPLDLSCFTALSAVAPAPPTSLPACLPLSRVSFPPSSVSFLPLPSSASPSNMLCSGHMI